MMNYILFDTPLRTNLLPLTFLRPIADIRIGMMTIREKWETILNVNTSTLTEAYLSEKFPLKSSGQNILINGSICPTNDLVAEILKLKTGESIIHEGILIALMTDDADELSITSDFGHFEKKNYTEPLIIIENTWDVFAKNGEAIEQDFKLLAAQNKSIIPKSIQFTGPSENIFIHPSVKINHAFLNASKGPIYLDEDSEVMEGAMIRGPFYLGKNATVKMGAKIYGPTTVGPFSKVGGELNNVVIFGYTNKGHEGFLGNAVIAEWCNIGADTNNSNLKNTYDEVKLWNYTKKSFVNTKLQFCGLIMGDHSKTGIDTMFNTGTVVGIASNLFGAGYQRNFIPSFSWGGPSKMIKHDLKRALITTEQVYERRGLKLGDFDKNILTYLYTQSQNDPQL